MWYVIWTKTGNEEKCKYYIDNYIGSEAFIRCVIPTKRISRYIKGKWVKVEEKLFLSYLFIESDDIDEFEMQLKNAVTFNKILKIDNIFLSLDKKDENALCRLIGDDGIIGESIGFIDGNNVIVTDGPMVGLEGNIKHIDRHKRLATLEIEMFDRVTEFKLALEIIEKK